MSKIISALLTALTRHETLTLPDLLLEKNVGLPLKSDEVEPVLQSLESDGFIQSLDGARPLTYTITNKGIDEAKSLEKEPTVFS